MPFHIQVAVFYYGFETLPNGGAAAVNCGGLTDGQKARPPPVPLSTATCHRFVKHPLVTVTHSILVGFYKLLGVTHTVGCVSLPVKLRKVVCDGAMGAEDYCVRFWVHWG